MAGAYGFPNRVIAEIVSELINHSEFCKFVYYLQEPEGADLLSLPKPDASKILNKHLFIGRRVYPVALESSSYVMVRMDDFKPEDFNSEKIRLVDVEITILVHNDHITTSNGTRDCALVSTIVDALDGKRLGGIGGCRIIRVNDMLGLPIDYSGYKLICRVKGFPNAMIELEKKKPINEGANSWFR